MNQNLGKEREEVGRGGREGGEGGGGGGEGERRGRGGREGGEREERGRREGGEGGSVNNTFLPMYIDCYWKPYKDSNSPSGSVDN